MAWAKECVKKGSLVWTNRHQSFTKGHGLQGCGVACLQGVDVNARLDAYGGTALFLAVEQGNWLMVKWSLGMKRSRITLAKSLRHVVTAHKTSREGLD